MKTKYDFTKTPDVHTFKRNLLNILTIYFPILKNYSENTILENINCVPLIDETAKGEFVNNWLKIIVRVPLPVLSNKSVILFKNGMRKIGFVFVSPPEIRNNYNPQKTNYSVLCENELQFTVNFTRDVKNEKIKKNNQLNLFEL